MQLHKLLIILFSIIFLLGGCKQMPQEASPPPPPETLGDIAYDVNEEFGYTVYIEENGENVPYLVLTNDYGGNVLLLRKLLLDEYVKYNDYYAYYNGSIIDTYLNETFLPLIDADLQEHIVDSEITITAESYIWDDEVHVPKVEQITRKLFLLSRTELGYKEGYTQYVEGVSLAYFTDDRQRRIAYNSTEASSWMLRTTEVLYFNSFYAISPDGTLGSGATSRANGVRPAFCLPRDLPIYKDALNGEMVYFISK